MPAELLFLCAKAKAGRALFHGKAGNPAGTLAAGPRHNDIDIRYAAAGDERLGAAEHIIVAVAPRPRAQRRRIRAGAWLRQAIAGKPRHAAQVRQPVPALCIVAEGVDHPGCHIVDGDEGCRRRAAACQLFQNQRRVDTAQPAAADIVAHIKAAEAQRGGGAQGFGRENRRLVPRLRMRRHLLAREIGGERLEGTLLLRELEVHGSCPGSPTLRSHHQ